MAIVAIIDGNGCHHGLQWLPSLMAMVAIMATCAGGLGLCTWGRAGVGHWPGLGLGPELGPLPRPGPGAWAWAQAWPWAWAWASTVKEPFSTEDEPLARKTRLHSARKNNH